MLFKLTPQLTTFYNTIRPMFGGTLKQHQFDGVDNVLQAFDGLDVRYVAYALATVFHETARTMQPIEEYGKGKAYVYGKKVKMNRQPYTTPDKTFYGRGLVQLTWYENYEAMTKIAKKQGKDWDMLNHPELLLQDDVSAWVLKTGMLNGSFTGKKLSDYFNDNIEDPINARKVINGRDKAETIANYYNQFKQALLK